MQFAYNARIQMWNSYTAATLNIEVIGVMGDNASYYTRGYYTLTLACCFCGTKHAQSSRLRWQPRRRCVALLSVQRECARRH